MQPEVFWNIALDLSAFFHRPAGHMSDSDSKNVCSLCFETLTSGTLAAYVCGHVLHESWYVGFARAVLRFENARCLAVTLQCDRARCKRVWEELHELQGGHDVHLHSRGHQACTELVPFVHRFVSVAAGHTGISRLTKRCYNGRCYCECAHMRPGSCLAVACASFRIVRLSRQPFLTNCFLFV